MADPKKELKRLRKNAQDKADYVDGQLAKLEKLLDKLGPLLTKEVFDEFLKTLDVENGQVLTNEQNLRKINLLEKAYNTFMEQQGYKVITMMLTDLDGITGKNLEYFEKLAGSKLKPAAIKRIVNERLGLNAKGELKRVGFMKGLLDDTTVKNQIKKFATDRVINGAGFDDFRTGLQTLIAGDSGKMGAFKQFYRNAAYDTYTRIDALNSKLHADKLKLEHFMYAGTRRKASRHFCLKRKGKVFTRAEAEEWKDLIGTYTTDDDGKRVPAGPIVSEEDKPTYNPLIDRGGYGCVDDIMWVSKEVAYARRPELRPPAPDKK